MENHPIPQDVTGFKFKLIGDMTVKQFAYLGGGCGIGFLLVTQVKLPLMLNIPLGIFFGILGIALAFLPIEGRSMDVMTVNFIRALFTPDEYVYQKIGGILFPQFATTKIQPAFVPTKQSGEKLKKLLNNLPQKPKNQLDEKELIFFKSLSSMFNPQQIHQALPVAPTSLAEKTQNQQVQPPKTQDKEELSQALQKEAILISKELEEVKKQESVQKENPSPILHQKVLDLENQLREVLSQKNSLEQKILNLQKTLESQKQKVFTPSAVAPKTETPNVRKIPKSMGIQVGAPLTPDAPNLLTGIVKDPRGNILPNILIEVKDKDGNPVRAFKTNALGQFASATPLTNSTYTIDFEDPKGANKFDTIELPVTGDVILPIEVISTDEREELRKALFEKVN